LLTVAAPSLLLVRHAHAQAARVLLREQGQRAQAEQQSDGAGASEKI
jgi:hypothetical protein